MTNIAMQQINLLDVSLLPKRQRVPLPALVALVGLVSTVLTVHLGYEMNALRKVMSAAAADQPQAAASSVADDSAPLQARIAVLEALRGQTESQARLPTQIGPTLNSILASLPDSVWLTEVDLGNASALRIAGATLDTNALPTLAARLARIPALKGVPVAILRIEPLPPATQGDAEANQPAASAHRFLIASSANQSEESE